MPNMPNQIVPYPAEVTVDQTTASDLYVSGDYEILLFGDPAIAEGQHAYTGTKIDCSTRILATSSGPMPCRRVDILGYPNLWDWFEK